MYVNVICMLNVCIIAMQVLSSADGPVASSSPVGTETLQLQQQLLEEKKISARLRGDLTHIESVCVTATGLRHSVFYRGEV